MLDHLFIVLLRATDAHSRVDIIYQSFIRVFWMGGERRGKGEKVGETVSCMLYFKVSVWSPSASWCGLFKLEKMD